MFKYIWEMGNLLVRDGKKELFDNLIHINLNQLCIIVFNTIFDQLMHG
jgi:hypothetical protein